MLTAALGSSGKEQIERFIGFIKCSEMDSDGGPRFVAWIGGRVFV